MPTITLEIPGKPLGKKSPRFYVKANGTLGRYNEQTTDEGRFLVFVVEQIRELGFERLGKEVPVRIRADFFFTRPKSHYRTGKNAHLLKDSAPVFHIVKPDEDNCTKFIKDCFKFVLWHDDCQVYKGGPYEKHWSDENKTVVTVEWEE